MPDGVRKSCKLDKIDVKKLQEFIIEHADVSQIDAESRQALLTRQLNLHELVLMSLVCNEGLLIFKPTTNNNFEVMFTHLQEFMCTMPTNATQQECSENVTENTENVNAGNEGTQDIQNLVQELQLDNEWLQTLQSSEAKTEAKCDTDSDLELDILLGRCHNEIT